MWFSIKLIIKLDRLSDLQIRTLIIISYGLLVNYIVLKLLIILKSSSARTILNLIIKSILRSYIIIIKRGRNERALFSIMQIAKLAWSIPVSWNLKRIVRKWFITNKFIFWLITFRANVSDVRSPLWDRDFIII